MGHIFVIAMVICALISVVNPWIGVVYGYLVVVLAPQDIWWWDFQGVRPEFWVLLAACVGVGLSVFTRKLDLSAVRNKRSLFIFVLWICFLVSYFYGPFTQATGRWRFDNPVIAIERLNKIVFFYFIASACITTERRAKVLYLVIVISAVYLTYWANDQYFTGHYFGRLEGPSGLDGTGNYVDQNDFAMLFVVAQPFLWYLGSSFKSSFLRWACWLVIPFSWNAVFLTGSRGGFLGLAVTILLISLRSKRRFLGLALIPAFIIVFLWEGGGVMKGRMDRLGEYQQNASAEGRLQAWRAAARMIVDHPITGVGLASFGPAFPHYSDKRPREAHNTLLQIAAESGVLAGAMYALIVLTLIYELWRNGRALKASAQPRAPPSVAFMINEATLIGFCGLVICSLFLSLQEFEIFYILNVLGNAVIALGKGRASEERSRAGMSATTGEFVS